MISMIHGNPIRSQMANSVCRIHQHYQHSLQSIDFRAQRATFAGPEGTSETAYDLLVGADGRHSEVVKQLQRFDPSFSTFQRPSPLGMVGFGGIPATGVHGCLVQPTKQRHWGGSDRMVCNKADPSLPVGSGGMDQLSRGAPIVGNDGRLQAELLLWALYDSITPHASLPCAKCAQAADSPGAAAELWTKAAYPITRGKTQLVGVQRTLGARPSSSMRRACTCMPGRGSSRDGMWWLP